jgi:hypothetical protein
MLGFASTPSYAECAFAVLALPQALYDGPESCPWAQAVAAAAARADGTPPPPLPPPRTSSGRAGLGGAAAAAHAGSERLDSATWQALSRLLSRKRQRLDPLQARRDG